MEIDAIIQTHVEYEKRRTEFNPAAREKARIWMSTIERAPRSADTIQSLMDAKEVTMNKTDDTREIRRLDWEWSALQWLRSLIMKEYKGRLVGE